MSVMSGKEIRMRRIFKDDGKAVISALDMGLFGGTTPGLEDVRAIPKAVVDAGADSIIRPEATGYPDGPGRRRYPHHDPGSAHPPACDAAYGKIKNCRLGLYKRRFFCYNASVPNLALWCSRLARQPVTLEVDGSSPFGVAIKSQICALRKLASSYASVAQ